MTPESRKRKTSEENIALLKSKTLSLIETQGYMNTSMNDIARETGINISLIYRYFPNGKPEILKAIGNDLIHQSKYPTDIGDIPDPVLFFHGLLTRFIAMHRKHGALLKSLTVAYLSNSELFEKERFGIITGELQDSLLFVEIFKKMGAHPSHNLEYEARMMFFLLDCMIHRHITTFAIGDSDEELVVYLSSIILNRIDALKKPV